ncbi:hypothetical protein [Prosthecomicrobium pneumaticum]|uniref:Nucleotide-diphospho-sugar transferase domain-containing protein n=1 Tax=Prosthecomicrobium pneumaticum TaxID=81895 RepID=A0A7W9FJE6_9HYPH|nr:hypothetical protein [Prosthecomicrobium pneumaticum]MBB5751632.1 hypothetical protein [Prosthecomicrobium pneumaticum]
MAGPGEFWAITAYFNPLRYRTRRENYRRFKDNIGCNLLAVELGFDGAFDLGADDADILVRRSSGSVLWQKERLLNIALESLPSSATHVAWVDCDIVFMRQDWVVRAREALENDRVVQLFEHLVDLKPGETHESPDLSPTGLGFAAWMSLGSPRNTDRGPNVRLGTPGFAWAAPRDLLAKHGFYDALVLGGGDRAFSSAASGDFEDSKNISRLSPLRMDHYMRWAQPIHQDIAMKIGFIDNTVYHYWHGERKDRGYNTRHRGFVGYDFDPERDITLSSEGTWVWGSDKKDMHAYVEKYFRDRHEDGSLGS